MIPLLQQVMGTAFGGLAPALRHLHGATAPERWRGTVSVEYPCRAFAPVARLGGLPQP